MPGRPSNLGEKSRMRSFFSFFRSRSSNDKGDNMEKIFRPIHRASTIAIQAGKMVGEGIGLPRTELLRRKLANKKGEPEHGETMAKAGLFNLSDEDFVKELDKAFRPEFDFLTRAESTPEEDDGAPVGNLGPNKDQLPSQLLYDGQMHIEVDRTIVGLLCMKWMMAGQYETFVSAQAASPVRLKKAEFESLRTFFIETFGNSSNSYMLIVSMVINDLGKNPEIKDSIDKQISEGKAPPEEKALVDDYLEKRNALNHDDLIYYAAKLNVLELIREFNGDRRAQLELGIELGSMLNVGQLAQGENVPGVLENVASILDGDMKAFNFKFLEVVLDVAGAKGHVDARGSKSWISPVHQSYNHTRSIVEKLIQGEVESSRQIYDEVLRHRGQILKDKGWKSLDVGLARDRALLRLMAMGRADNPKTAQKIEDAFESLPTSKTDPVTYNFMNRPIDNLRQALIDGLNVDGIADGVAIIPYYSPATFQNIFKYTKDKDAELQRDAVAAFLRLLARLFVGSRSSPACNKGYIVECNLETSVKQAIKDPAFAANPRVLDSLVLPTAGTEAYNRDIELLMKECYDIRPLSRRNTPKSSTT